MDDRSNELKAEYEYHISEHEAWREGPWFSGMHILRGQAESLRHPGGKSPSPHSPDSASVHRPSKDGVVEDRDMAGSGCNGSTQPPDSFGPTSIRHPSRPPMSRSYGSSSASSASTLMT